MSKKPQLYKFKDIENRLHTLEPGKSYIKPFVTSKVSDTMCGGLNFLNKVSVPWDLTCDEIIYCMEGTFRLRCDGTSYICNPGDVLYIPKDNHIAYECDEKCVIFYVFQVFFFYYVQLLLRIFRNKFYFSYCSFLSPCCGISSGSIPGTKVIPAFCFQS